PFPGTRSRLFLWEVSSGKLLARSPELHDSLVRLAVRPDGLLVACATSWGAVLLWDPSTRKVRRLFGPSLVSTSIRGLAFAPGGNRLAALRGDSVLEFDLDGFVAGVPLGNPRVAALSPDARLVAAYPSAGVLSVHDLGRGTSRSLAPPGRGDAPPGLSFAPDGRTLLAWD